MKIYGYYEIDIEVKKDWFGIFFTIFIGSLEIVGGCFLLWATGGQIGSEFIEEGYEDIKYGIECLIGKKEFSWSDYKKKKISFLINTAISITIKLLTAGISGFSKFKPQTALKTVFKQVGKTIAKRAAIDIGKAALTHFIGPAVVEKVINKVKDVLRNGVIEFFGNKLKSLIPDEFRSLMCVNVTVYKGRNPVERILKEQLKILLKTLSKLVKLLVDILFSLFSSKKLDAILAAAKNSAFSILKDGLKDSLGSLVSGSISELWKLIKGEIGKNKIDMISSWPEYLVKGAKVCQNIIEAEDLTSLLAQNGVLSLDGELNNEGILEGKKIKLNIGINNSLLRNISKPILDYPQKEVEKIITDFINEIKFRLEQEIRSLYSIISEQFYTGINILREKKEEMKNSILSIINSNKEETIHSSIDILNNLRKAIINSSNYKKEFVNEKYEKFENIFINIEEKFNNKIKNLITGLINDIFGDFDPIKIINEKIDINMIIKKIENISEILKKIIDEILIKYIPLFKVVSAFINNEALDKFFEDIKAIMNKILNILDEKIIPILNLIKEINKLNKKGLTNFILDKINIPINSGKITEIMKIFSIIKNDYIKINENNANEILKKIDGLIESIYDLDDEINENEEELLEQLLEPFEEIINKIDDIITKKIEEKINNIISTLETELENAEKEIKNIAKNILNKIMQKGLNLIPQKKIKKGIKKGIKKVLQKGDKCFKKTKDILEKVIKKPGLFKTFESLQKGMNEYEKSSQMDETINILNDCIIDQLFDLLCQALQNSKIGELIAKGAKSLLREMESSKKNLRTELKGIGALPEKENATSLNSQLLLKNNSKNNNSRNENKFRTIKNAFSQLMSIIENVINNIFKKNFKYPEGSNTIIYINLKFGENPFKKILIKELEISLHKLKDIIQILSDFLKKMIKFLKGDDNPIDSFRSLYDEFSNNSFLKIKEGLSESIQNIKIGLISLIKDLILGKSKSQKFDGVILTWTDYFIKGIKICSTIDEAQTLSESLIENGIISIDGELNKEKILEIKDLKQIKIKKFPLKLNIDLKENYNKLESNIKQKICGSIPDYKILKIIDDLEKDITFRIKEEKEKITQNYTNIIEKGTNFVLEKENECKQLIKNEINIFMEKCIKEITNILQKEKNIIEKGSNAISNEINELSNSIEEKINNFEDIINNKIKEITTILINKVFESLELIKNLKKKNKFK